MGTYPAQGSSPWDTQLKTYIDDADALVQSQIDPIAQALIDDAFEGYVPGTELLYAERLTPFATTATVIGTAANVTGLSGTVIGKGRPVAIDVDLSGLYHSIANTGVLAYLAVNGVVLTTPYGLLEVGGLSPVTNSGPAHKMTRRLVLADTVSYLFQVGIYGGAAGTSTLSGAAYQANSLTVTAR